MYNAQLIINGETIDIKRLPNDKLDELVAYFTALENEKEYKIVGEPGDYQIMEQFGDYRMTAKRFKTVEQAERRIEQMGGKVKK